MHQFSEPVKQWLSHLQTNKRYSSHTLTAYEQDLQHLADCLPNIKLKNVTEHDIRTSLAQLHAQGLKPRSLARALAAWRGFYQWYSAKHGFDGNPAAMVKAPKANKPLPASLSVEQAQTLLDRPNLPAPNTPVEWRDQAMFEILYSSGLRLSELVLLDHTYTRENGYESGSWIAMPNSEAIVKGKGNKTRTVPLGSKAIQAIKSWLNHRDLLACNAKTFNADSRAALFLGVRGARISPRVVQIQLNKLAALAGLPVNISPHSLRHSFASHMLQSAQDLRAVQELLGHANISTTQIYTKLDFQHLASVYDKAHPRANRKKD